MSKEDITVTGGEIPAVDPTNGPPAPKIVSAASAQKANAVEGAEETSARPDFSYTEAATRRNGEW